MEFRRQLNSLWHWLWVLPIVALLFAVLAYQATQRIPPTYEARATLLVNASSTPDLPNYYNDSMLSQQLVKTYSQLASTPAVLEGAAASLGLSLTPDQLQRLVTVQPVRDTQLFAVTARSRDAAQARNLANAVADVFIARQDLLAVDGISGGITVVQPALQPPRPIEPRPVLNVVMASLFGLLLASGLVFLGSSFDATVKDPLDLERAGIKVLGSIKRLLSIAGASREFLSSRVLAEPAVADSYHALRIRLESSASVRPLRTMLVTSAGRGEGRSTVAAGLALSFAQSGKRVMVVDADFRKPALHRIFNLSEGPGLSDLLKDFDPDSSLDYAREGSFEGLHVITSGRDSHHLTELLQRPQVYITLERLVQAADVVLLDGPPALLADGLALAHYVDATLLVVGRGRTKAPAVADILGILDQSGARVMGAVLNAVPHRKSNSGGPERKEGTDANAAPVESGGISRVLSRWRKDKDASHVLAGFRRDGRGDPLAQGGALSE